MSKRALWLITGVIAIVVIVAVIVWLTSSLGPEINPAYAVAITFTNAAGKGDDAAAEAVMSAQLREWVADNCPDGSLGACIDAYSPPEWGAFTNAVFRRAQGNLVEGYDVQMVATYEDDQGFSGVCIYNRVDPTADGGWEVTRWTGWVSCDLPNSGLSSLANDADAPNAAP